MLYSCLYQQLYLSCKNRNMNQSNLTPINDSIASRLRAHMQTIKSREGENKSNLSRFHDYVQTIKSREGENKLNIDPFNDRLPRFYAHTQMIQSREGENSIAKLRDQKIKEILTNNRLILSNDQLVKENNKLILLAEQKKFEADAWKSKYETLRTILTQTNNELNVLAKEINDKEKVKNVQINDLKSQFFLEIQKLKQQLEIVKSNDAKKEHEITDLNMKDTIDNYERLVLFMNERFSQEQKQSSINAERVRKQLEYLENICESIVRIDLDNTTPNALRKVICNACRDFSAYRLDNSSVDNVSFEESIRDNESSMEILQQL